MTYSNHVYDNTIIISVFSRCDEYYFEILINARYDIAIKNTG